MERAVIRVSGTVQGVGFRYAVRARARSAGITGYVKNNEDNTVEIVAEGARPYIESFIRKIRSVGEPVVVDDIQVSHQEATGEFKRFEVITGDLRTELMEGFGAGHMLFERSFQKQDEMLGHQQEMLNKQDQTIATIQGYSEKMLNKQDQTIATIQGYSEKMLDKQDQTIATIQGYSEKMLDKQDQTIATIQGYSEKMLNKQDQTTSEVRVLSNNLGGMMDRRFQRLDGEISLIKEKMDL